MHILSSWFKVTVVIKTRVAQSDINRAHAEEIPVRIVIV
jgi:hypothetical protein